MICIFCTKDFSNKAHLKRHITNDRCNNISTEKIWELYSNVIENDENKYTNIINNNNNSININISINVNPVNKVELGYLEPIKMKKLIEEYSYEKSNLLFTDYIKDIIHNKEYPENHCVKYIKKCPPTYINVIEKDGDIVKVIKNLKDSCELLSEPVLETLKKKLKECSVMLKTDCEFNNMYEDTVKEIYKELNKEVVKKALKSVLEDNILNDIEMKMNVLPTC